MTPRTFLLLLAALFVAPAAARAAVPPPIKGPGCGGLDGSIVAGAVAEAAVAAAAERADGRVRQLGEIPVEFARATFTLPYGSEILPEPRNPTKKQVRELLEEKARYWKIVGDSLAKEQERIDKEIAEMSKAAHNGVEDAILTSQRLGRLRDAATAIAGDVAADLAALDEKGGSSGQELLDRKLALARRLAALNPKPKQKP